ncbi:ROK family protein [Calditrichota bacterium GD2]
MQYHTVIGVDLGGTNVRAARITGEKIEDSFAMEISARAESEVVLQQVIDCIAKVKNHNVEAIGVGVPGLVEMESGMVYDVVNIPSWKKIKLGEILQNEFGIPVAINNDANCFVLGEAYFGLAKGYDHVVGITLGTGLGSGLVLNGKLYSGANSGAGEFGMLPYKDFYYEYYCSGQFFQKFYQTTGQEAYQKAVQGDQTALKMFEEFGHHLGNALLAVFYALDPQIIVLGGAVSKAFLFFEKAMRQSLKKAVFQKSVNNLRIEVSRQPHIALLGAAALAMDFDRFVAKAVIDENVQDINLLEKHG